MLVAVSSLIQINFTIRCAKMQEESIGTPDRKMVKLYPKGIEKLYYRMIVLPYYIEYNCCNSIQMGSAVMKTIRDSEKNMLFRYEHHCWVYDDGSFLYGLYDNEERVFLETKAVDNEGELDEYLGFVEEKLKEMDGFCSPKRTDHKMHIGTKYMRANWYEYLECGESSVEKLEALLTAYASNGSIQEVVRLFSLVLAGFISRQFLKQAATISSVCNRAPIVSVIPQKGYYGGYPQLEYLFRAFAVDTEAEGNLEVNTSAVLPDGRDDRKLIDGAYIQINGDMNEKRFPAQYRDQAVLIHTRFFSMKDIRKFVNRNRWAAIFLFGKNQPKDLLGVVTLDANKMGFPKEKPETEEVRSLICRFVQWLGNEKKQRQIQMNLWEDAARDDIYRFFLAAESTGANVQIEEEISVIQLAAIHAFLAFCSWEEGIDAKKCATLLEKLGNALLPGSQTEEAYNKSVDAENAECERERIEDRALLEKLLGAIIRKNDMNKLVFVQKGEDFQRTNKVDLENEPWAALSYKNGEGPKIIKIRRNYLCALAASSGIMRVNRLKKILNKIDDGTISLDYADRTYNANLRIAGKSKSYTAITLLAEKLDFLTQEEQNLLLQKYPPQE